MFLWRNAVLLNAVIWAMPVLASQDSSAWKMPGAGPAQVPQAQAAGGPRLVVNSVAFSGNKQYDQDTLQSHIADAMGQALTLAEIRALADRIRDKYHQNGFRLANVVVPAQTFAADQPVQMVVFEGWLDIVDVKGNQRYQSKRVMDALSAHGVNQGQAFTFESLERALTRINRQSGVSVGSILKSGAESGATTLQVNVAEAKRVRGAVELNNYGSENTGEVRLQTSVELPNATGRGDVFSMLVLKSVSGEGTFFGRLAYETPVGHKGFRVSTYVSQGDSSIGGDFSALQIRGDNQSIGVGVLRENIKSPSKINVVEAWLESQDIQQNILGTTTSDDRVRKLRIGYTQEQFKTNHRSVWSVQLHQGLGEFLGGMPNNDVLSSRAVSGADNQFTKLTMTWSRLQRLGARTQIVPRVSAQLSTDPLVVGEQISIGGFYSVAGHAPSARSGDSGIVANLEGRFSARADDDRVQYFARLDHGQVMVNKTFIGQKRHESLTGAAVGLVLNPLRNLSMRVEYAKPLGNRTDEGQYVYAQVRYQF